MKITARSSPSTRTKHPRPCDRLVADEIIVFIPNQPTVSEVAAACGARVISARARLRRAETVRGGRGRARLGAQPRRGRARLAGASRRAGRFALHARRKTRGRLPALAPLLLHGPLGTRRRLVPRPPTAPLPAGARPLGRAAIPDSSAWTSRAGRDAGGDLCTTASATRPNTTAVGERYARSPPPDVRGGPAHTPSRSPPPRPPPSVALHPQSGFRGGLPASHRALRRAHASNHVLYGASNGVDGKAVM